MSVIPPLRDGEQRVFFKVGGEWCYLWTPASYENGKSVPVVIHHHGARGYVRDGESDWLDTESKTAYLRAVMAGGGCAIAGSHACGDHWGNPDSVAANAALYEGLLECPGIDATRVGLMGGGLGGALIWNSVLGPLAWKVKAAVVMQAVANLTAVIREQKYKTPCIRAYGLPEETPDDEAIAKVHPYDPMPRLQALKPGTLLPRTAIYHGFKDANIPAETNAKPLAAALEAAGGVVELNIFPDVEHNVYAMGKPIEKQLKAFFAEAL
jgi:dipeptidyl aminopeptidase/acylaminoacyl peptidase